MKSRWLLGALALSCGAAWAVDDYPKPYSSPCVERENVFEFTEKPAVKNLGNDKYEIAFATAANCDVTVGIVDEKGAVVRHLGAGVLGSNAPLPFQKNTLKQTILWNGKDDQDSYVKEPDKLKVRVQLGLNPQFDRRLGVTNPKSIPGSAWGICIDVEGAYVIAKPSMGIRKFDHDGNYVRTLFPPPANFPQDKLQGLGFVEYEPGRKSLHSPGLGSVCGGTAGGLPIGREPPVSCQPIIANGRIYYCTLSVYGKDSYSLLHYVCADGSTETKGMVGRKLIMALAGSPMMGRPNFAASPDGRWLYLAGDDGSGASWAGGMDCAFRCSMDGNEPAAVFAGEKNKPGSDNGHFNRAQGIDCDSQGRVYVCDNVNGRIQVFSPEGKHLKTIPIDRPIQIKVHRKTGAIYVLHVTRVQGTSANRISKIVSFETPAVESYFHPPAGLMALDSWTPKPRIWLAGSVRGREGGGIMDGRFSMEGADVRIWEEDGKGFRKIADFAEEVKKEAGSARIGNWSGSTTATFGKIVCDPVREKAYFMNSWAFDLKTGVRLGDLSLSGTDDLAFDKRGYMHCHFNPGVFQPGVGRLDPSRGLTECPYDYGVEAQGWLGVLPVRDQPGAKFFQDGIGVNMRGDVAENCNIYFAPRMDEEAQGLFRSMSDCSGSPKTYAGFMRGVLERQKRGEEVYSIRPKPGTPVAGATIWTYDGNGELRDECAVITGLLINGVMMDEDGGLYFVNNRTRLVNGKPFLAGRGGVFGAGKDAKGSDPFTGTLFKTGRRAKVLSTAAPIKMEERSARPPELGQYHEEAWIEGAEWMYAGASPIVPGGCSCPTMRCHTDWYKRTFVPEAYRQAIGILDTAGNLILHLGQYGNFESGYGPASKVPVGGDGIAFSDARIVSGTDNYLCFCDRGERLIVLKLNYHAEETVGIGL